MKLFVLLIVAGSCTSVARCADKKAILQETNRAYYNLKAQGLDEFSCQVLPDWDSVFDGTKADTVAREKILPLVRQMKFQVAIGPSGAASVSHEFHQAPPSEQVASGLRQVSEGMDQMLSGFFQTWSQLMINPPLPGTDQEYQMEERGNGYRFTADEAETHIAVSINRDLVIDTIEAKTPEFEGIVHPQFSRREGGLVLDSYDGTYKTKGGISQQMSVKIQYQEVEGLALPRKITLFTALPQGQLNWPMTFDDCQVKKK